MYNWQVYGRLKKEPKKKKKNTTPPGTPPRKPPQKKKRRKKNPPRPPREKNPVGVRECEGDEEWGVEMLVRGRGTEGKEKYGGEEPDHLRGNMKL